MCRRWADDVLPPGRPGNTNPGERRSHPEESGSTCRSCHQSCGAGACRKGLHREHEELRGSAELIDRQPDQRQSVSTMAESVARGCSVSSSTRHRRPLSTPSSRTAWTRRPSSIPMYAKLSRLRLFAAPSTISAAEAVSGASEMYTASGRGDPAPNFHRRAAMLGRPCRRREGSLPSSPNWQRANFFDSQYIPFVIYVYHFGRYTGATLHS